MNAYEINQLASGIEVGDTVKVLETSSDFARGWVNTWTEDMTEKVGKTFRVSGIYGDSGVSDGMFCYPYFVLEIVKKADK